LRCAQSVAFAAVPGDADAREQRDFLAPQSGDPAPAEHRQLETLGRDRSARLARNNIPKRVRRAGSSAEP
jgi:hypothetical protein